MNETNPPSPETISVQNSLGQPVGLPLPGWKAPPVPSREPMLGCSCRLEPLDPERHAADLYAANSLDKEQRMWTYMTYGPFGSFDDYAAWLRSVHDSPDPLFFAVIDLATDRPVGVVSYLRIQPASGSIEVGHLAYSPRLQRTSAATESMYLMMKKAFELGYRRYEWKCDALNAPSRAAALRLGFRYEGIFRKATVYKERSRDTAWFSIIDSEWPKLEAAFSAWLAPENFDAAGRQKARLSEFMTALLPQQIPPAPDCPPGQGQGGG